MAVLGNLGTMFVRDKNGQMVPVPVIRGEDGGFYTPEIKDGVIRWVASRPDMPAIPEMDIGTGGGGTPDAVQFVPQELTDKQQAQARENIGAARTYTLQDGETIDDAPEDADIVWDPENEGEGAGDGDGVPDEELKEVHERIDVLEDEIADLKENGAGGAVVSSVEPAEDDIPKIFLGSPLQQTKDELVTTFSYRSKTLGFDCYAVIKMQGNSTTMWAKKNQTVKLYTDADCTEKLKIDFKAWGKQNKFVIKAYWNDITQTRDIVSVRLESDCAKTRSDYETMPEQLRTSPNMGAVDGFPVLVWAAGIYQGRYMWNIPKDKWMNNMDDELETNCMLVSEDYNSGCFRAPAKIDESDWTDEIHDTVPASIKTRWNEIITFVQTATDDEFKANLGNYFNVNSLVDRHLMGLYSCDYDGYGKNQRYDTYDGQVWYAVPYDKDGTWGCYWNGSKVLPSDYGRNQYEDYTSTQSDGSGNLLFIRLEQLFWPEMQNRWAELKAGPLSIANTINRFRELYDITPPYLREEDYASTTANGAFINMPQVKNLTAQQFQTFAVERHAWMDDYISGLKYIPCTGIMLSASTLTFSGAGIKTLTATVTPDDCTENIVWTSDNTDVATVSNGVVTPIADGNCTITATCGAYSATCVVSVSDLSTCTITNNLTNVSNDNASTNVVTGGSYTANLTVVSDEYAIDTVTVTMGGEDVTASVYNDGTIYIETVTGDIVITATAKANPILYQAKDFAINEKVWVGTDSPLNCDNGNHLYKNSHVSLETDIDFTVVFDAVSPIDAPTTYDGRCFAMSNYNSVLVAFNGANLKVNYHGGTATLVAMDNAMKAGDRVRVVATHISGSNTMNAYVRITNDDGTDATYTAQSTGTWSAYDGTIQAQQGVFDTVDEFTVYNYAMTADEANAWLTAE